MSSDDKKMPTPSAPEAQKNTGLPECPLDKIIARNAGQLASFGAPIMIIVRMVHLSVPNTISTAIKCEVVRCVPQNQKDVVQQWCLVYELPVKTTLNLLDGNHPLIVMMLDTRTKPVTPTAIALTSNELQRAVEHEKTMKPEELSEYRLKLMMPVLSATEARPVVVEEDDEWEFDPGVDPNASDSDTEDVKPSVDVH
jgi:hypothetical protein